MPLIPFCDTLTSLRNCGSNTINGVKLNDFQRFQVFSDAVFALINMVVVCFIGLGMFIIRHSDTVPLRMLNMSIYCNATEYNMKLMSPPNTFFLYFSIIMVFTIVFVTTISKNFVLTPIRVNAWKRIAGELFSIGIHFFMFCLMMELIKLISGVPSPYYFSYQELQDYYCPNKSILIKQPYDQIKALDRSLRTSFPSYRAAVFSYCTTFLYLYVDHFDVVNGLHTTQQVILLLFGGFSTHLLINHIEHGENHVEDVVAGVTIGFFYAIITIRNLFGSVLYERTHKWIIEEEKCNPKPSTEIQTQESTSLINSNNGHNGTNLGNNLSCSTNDSIDLNEIIVTPHLHVEREDSYLRVSSAPPYEASTSSV